MRQIQLRVKDLERIGNRILRIGHGKAKKAPEEREGRPDPRERDRVYKPEGEATPKAMDALKKGADATRGRGHRRGRVYQRAGIRN